MAVLEHHSKDVQYAMLMTHIDDMHTRVMRATAHGPNHIQDRALTTLYYRYAYGLIPQWLTLVVQLLCSWEGLNAASGEGTSCSQIALH